MKKKIVLLEKNLRQMDNLSNEGTRRIQYREREIDSFGNGKEEIVEYNIFQTSIHIRDVTNAWSLYPGQDGLRRAYHSFNILSNNDEKMQKSLRMSDEEKLKLVDEFKNIQTIHIHSQKEDSGYYFYRLDQRMDKNIIVSERFIMVLSLLIENNKNCEIHFHLSINHFMLKEILSKIKLQYVSKVILLLVHDVEMYRKNPYIKMTQQEFTDSQMKSLLENIYHKNKIHIISPMI